MSCVPAGRPACLSGRAAVCTFPAIRNYLLQRHDALLKDAPALFIILKHSPACTGRAEQYIIADIRINRAHLHRLLHILRIHDFRESVLLGTLGNLIPGLSDQDKITHLSFKLRHPVSVFAVLVLTACNQQGWSRHGPKRLYGRIRVGSLGVIVIPDPCPLTDEFNPVLNRVEVFRHPADIRQGNAH